jgi:hypothetical protein
MLQHQRAGTLAEGEQIGLGDAAELGIAAPFLARWGTLTNYSGCDS